MNTGNDDQMDPRAALDQARRMESVAQRRGRWHGWVWLAIGLITPIFLIGAGAEAVSRPIQFWIAIGFMVVGATLAIWEARRGLWGREAAKVDRPLHMGLRGRDGGRGARRHHSGSVWPSHLVCGRGAGAIRAMLHRGLARPHQMSQLHPRHRLDELIHSPVRLSMMASLAAADSIDFRRLRDLIEVSDSLLSKHISTLEDAGYISVRKGYEGKRPRTWMSLTAQGRDAYATYVTVLASITEPKR